MEIDKKLHEEIKEYCKLNGMKMGEYVNSLLRKAFNEDRFGIMPSILMPDTESVKKIKEEKLPDDYGKPKMAETQKISVPGIENELGETEKEEIKPKKTIRRLK